MTAPVRLHVERIRGGSERPTPLVLVHGFTGDSSSWDRLLPHLDPHRPVWAVDLPGHGRSPDPDDRSATTMEAIVASLAAAAAEISADAVHWLGYSMGGRAVLSLAVNRPRACASVTLVGASPGIADPAERSARRLADDALAAALERDGIVAFVDAWEAQPLFASHAALAPDVRAALQAQRLRNRPGAIALVLRGAGTGAMPPLWERLGDVRAPVLLVAGEHDHKFRLLAKRMAAGLPDARPIVIAESGHSVHLEAPAALAATVTGFLRALEAG